MTAQYASGIMGADDSAARWAHEQERLVALLGSGDNSEVLTALRAFAKIVDSLELYAPALKGLHDVHAFACDRLEQLVFDGGFDAEHTTAAAYLYGRAMALSTLTEEAVALAVEHLLSRSGKAADDLVLAVLLGVEKSNTVLFESHVAAFLQQIEAAAFTTKDELAREALLRALELYDRSEHADTCQLVLAATHSLLAAALELCGAAPSARTRDSATVWCCFILEHASMTLRIDLCKAYPQTCDTASLFATLRSTFQSDSRDAQVALCGALPVLTTWETVAFTASDAVSDTVDFMLQVSGSIPRQAMRGLGQLACVVLDKFEPYADSIGQLALTILRNPNARHHSAAQRLISSLLMALGPMVQALVVQYLHLPPPILLGDTRLLVQIATLLPNLAIRITVALVEIINGIMQRARATGDSEQHQAVLAALTVFPLDDQQLIEAAQRLVLWSLDEDQGRDVVVAALQLATIPDIATAPGMEDLTYKAAQLLLADDPNIVHVALSVLSSPSLASALDERSCSMLLLALHQSLEPSIQIVAARLLTHLTMAHRAIVQPLAWSHIRQSLSLMEFLRTVDPSRACVEACIISNLLPALPAPLHQKYASPVKDLILAGLRQPKEGATLSLIFQGLANLAKFEGWGSAQQSQLALDILEMAREIPKDAQHAALNAVARLLSVPQPGLDAYEVLLTLHSTFGGDAKLDPDLKSLVSAVYGHLGTIERNPVVSRDSRAAINRESAIYTPRTVIRSQVAEVRDRAGAGSQAHINSLVAKTLAGVMASMRKASDDRAVVLEILTAEGVLQPHAMPALIPDLPALILDDVQRWLALADDASAGAALPNAAMSMLHLASALHVSPQWLQQYWPQTADTMAECVKAGDGLAVLKGLNVILDAVKE